MQAFMRMVLFDFRPTFIHSQRLVSQTKMLLDAWPSKVRFNGSWNPLLIYMPSTMRTTHLCFLLGKMIGSAAVGAQCAVTYCIRSRGGLKWCFRMSGSSTRPILPGKHTFFHFVKWFYLLMNGAWNYCCEPPHYFLRENRHLKLNMQSNLCLIGLALISKRSLTC